MTALALGACGGEDPAFDADDFVAAANARGAGLTLGAPLPTTREGVTLHGLAFTAGNAGVASPGSSGTLVVTPGDDEALAEYERCEASGNLICFRAANVALYFEADPADLARVVGAITAMGEGDD